MRVAFFGTTTVECRCVRIRLGLWDDGNPFAFHHKDIKYMLYNGNGFGQDGLGLAIEVVNK